MLILMKRRKQRKYLNGNYVRKYTSYRFIELKRTFLWNVRIFRYQQAIICISNCLIPSLILYFFVFSCLCSNVIKDVIKQNPAQRNFLLRSSCYKRFSCVQVPFIYILIYKLQIYILYLYKLLRGLSFLELTDAHSFFMKLKNFITKNGKFYRFLLKWFVL